MTAPRVIEFTLPKPTPLLNVTQRQHWSARRRYCAATGWAIKQALRGALPSAPFASAHVRIERYSAGTPDHDGLVGGCKGLIDCLTTPVAARAGAPRRNPFGLGFILDDAPAYMELEVVPFRCKRAEQRTIVRITEILR